MLHQKSESIIRIFISIFCIFLRVDQISPCCPTASESQATIPVNVPTTTISPTSTGTSSTSTTSSSSSSSSTTTTTSSTTTSPSACPTGCQCPAGTSGVIYDPSDAQIVQDSRIVPLSTCGGCPNGKTQFCYPTQPSQYPNSTLDVPSVAVNCANYSNVCICPSDCSQCFLAGPVNTMFNMRVYSYCDASAVCQSYVLFESSDGLDSLSNDVDAYFYNFQFDEFGNFIQFGVGAPYVQAGTLAISCNGCGTVSTNGMNTGTAITCSGPLTPIGK